MFQAAYRSSSGALTVFAASWWWVVCRSKHGEPSMNGGLINSITRLHLVGYFYRVILRCTDPWILNWELVQVPFFLFSLSLSLSFFWVWGGLQHWTYHSEFLSCFVCFIDVLTWDTSNDMWPFMIYAFEKYCITREHISLKWLHFISMLWLLLLQPFRYQQQQHSGDVSWHAYTSADRMFWYDKPTSVLQDTVYDLLTKC
jgi:hypothetical protein